jgi:hypothetical protein
VLPVCAGHRHHVFQTTETAEWRNLVAGARAVYSGILLDVGHNADEADAFGRSQCRLIGMGVLGLDKTEWKSRSPNRAFLDKRLLKSMCFDRYIGTCFSFSKHH